MRCSERFMSESAARRLTSESGWARRAPQSGRCLAESFQGADSLQCDATVLKRVRIIGLQTDGVIEIRESARIVVGEQIDIAAGIVGGGRIRGELDGLSQLGQCFRIFSGL